ncbi:MAG: S-layer homology domain-containing protein [Candidatus Peregrinibacteria bacterium]
MKHLVSFLLFGIVLFPSGALAQTFSDVLMNHPYAQDIQYLTSAGIVSGYADGTFKPDATINRAEFLKILIEAKYTTDDIKNCIDGNIPEDWTYVHLSDVPRDAWFAPYVCQAKKEGIVSGYADGTFKPSQTITLAEAAKMVVNTMIGIEYEKVEAKINSSDWWQPFITKLEENKNIPQTLQISNAQSKEITRGEMASLIYSISHDGSLPLIPCATWGGQNTIHLANVQQVGGYDVSIQPSCIILLDQVKKEYAVFDNIGEFIKSIPDGASGGFNISLQGKTLTMNIWKPYDTKNYAMQEMGPITLPTGSFFSSDAEWESIAKKIETKTFNLSFRNY